jgi:protein-S-isoprenylcysteine O-methyltransferase Ste14
VVKIRSKNAQNMMSLIFRNLFFTILQPGIVAGLIPYWILGESRKVHFGLSFELYQIVGIAIFLGGFTMMLMCIASFAIKGKGTLSPADPTKVLVTTGLYEYSRNPMYVGVMLVLIGEALFFQSIKLVMYGAFIFLAFNTFIILWEEPRLRNDFGVEYDNYYKKVRRWI